MPGLTFFAAELLYRVSPKRATHYVISTLTLKNRNFTPKYRKGAVVRHHCHFCGEHQVFPDEQPTSDDRRHPRLDCGGVADLRVLPNGWKETGSLLNLSKRGCCFLADKELRGIPGVAVEVHIKVRGVDLRLPGVIRHVLQWRRAGIEFVELSNRKCEQIDELIAELAELSKAVDFSDAAARKRNEKESTPNAS